MNSVLVEAKPTKVGWYSPEGGVHQPTLVGFALISAEFIRRGPVGNYRSFAEPAMLSMVATSAKSQNKELDASTTFQLPGQPRLLTSAAIYGANASGKSNFVSALRFMRQL